MESTFISDLTSLLTEEHDMELLSCPFHHKEEDDMCLYRTAHGAPF